MLEDPSVRGIMINAWDITYRKRVEDELRVRDRAIAASSNSKRCTKNALINWFLAQAGICTDIGLDI